MSTPRSGFEVRWSAPFWISWAIDGAVALVFAYFFVVGLGDGSVDSFNIVLWIVILLVLTGVLAGGLALKTFERPGLATLLVVAFAVPSVLIGLFMLALLFTPAH